MSERNSGDELTDEFRSLKTMHSAECCEKTLLFFKNINVSNLDTLFANLDVAVRIFCTIPSATVSSAHSSLLALKGIGNVFNVRPCGRDGLPCLGVLAV